MVSPALASVGVEAVVKGLSKFMGDVGNIDKSIAGLIPTNSLLGKAFTGLGNIVQWLTGSVLRVLEYTLGSLLSAAIQSVVSDIKEMISEIMVSADELQKLEVRLNRFNLNEIRDSYDDVNKAQEVAIEMTKEQLRWLNKLAATTPYDAADVAQTYSLARSYGFAAEEAKTLTREIAEFASGMGLTGTHIERIIQNFGQMKAAGKITGTEIRDLARGAFVPVNDILGRVAENLGITTEELDKLRKKGLTDAEMFFAAFGEMVEEDFAGATEDMNKVLSVSVANLKDMARAFISLEVVTPIMDVLAQRANALQKALFARWDDLEPIFARIGKSLAYILEKIVGVGPSADEMASGIVTSLDMVATWLETNADGIVDWAKNAYTWITGTLVPAIQTMFGYLFGNAENTGALQIFGAWVVSDLIPAIAELSRWIGDVLIPFLQRDLVPVFLALLPLGTALKDVLFVVLGTEPNKSLSDWIHDDLIPVINDLTAWIKENKDEIAEWVIFFGKLFIILEIIGFVAKLIGIILIAITTIGAIIAALALFSQAIAVVIAIIAALGIIFLLIRANIDVWSLHMKSIAENIKIWFQDMINILGETISKARENMINGNWAGVGYEIIRGLARGVESNAYLIYNTLADMARNALSVVMGVFNANSPSKEFMKIGAYTMQGLAEGISASAGLAVKAMAGAANLTMSVGAQMPSMMASAAAPGSVTNTTTNNYNLAINSSASTEPIIQDFNMLSSLSPA